MFEAQTIKINYDKFSRCEEREQAAAHGENPDLIRKTDSAIKENIQSSLEKNDLLRALADDEIDVDVKNGVVYLNGHIAGTTSQSSIENAARAISGISGIKNNLVLDDNLTIKVAESLANLEHAYACKFFTGTSHGVVSIDGVVDDEHVKSLAEKCAADIPNVRGLINNIRVSNSKVPLQNQPFLQPAIGEIIYFLDGVSAVVKQVVINPNNRRVIAMTLQGNFPDPRHKSKPPTVGTTPPPEKLVVVSMNAVRYITKDSGFLHISSNERSQIPDLDPRNFIVPARDWIPPYPYCADDVLFPVEYKTEEIPIEYATRSLQFVESSEGPSFKKQFFANDSRGEAQ